MERQLDRLSAEGWQLEGTGWLSFRYRRGKPNEYRYRVQYLYESRDGQKDDYVRGLAELGVELVMDIGSFLILRRRNDGTPFELFSDLDSQITSEKQYFRTRCALAAARLLLARAVGRSPNGHALWHLPQLIHAVSSGIFVWDSANARIALLFFTIGIASEKIALPIIGPPMIIFFGSSLPPRRL